MSSPCDGCAAPCCRFYDVFLSGYDAGLIGLSDGGKYCPPDAWHLEGIDVPLHRTWHHHRDRQRILYDALVDGWNARLVAEREGVHHGLFYHFLFNAYRELERRDP